MPEAGLAAELSKPEVGSGAQSKLPNLVARLVRGIWVRFRSLIVELLTFPVRIGRIDGYLIVSADLPGLKKEEIRVDLTDSVLVIEAEPNREEEAFFRRAGRRIIPLPDGAGVDLAMAQLRNGVLTVSLPVSNLRKGRKVAVEEVIDVNRAR